jgi:hypothetical protein
MPCQSLATLFTKKADIFCRGNGKTLVSGKSQSLKGTKLSLPDFSWYNIPKREKHTKLPPYIPNHHAIHQMAIKYTKWQQHIP